MPWNLQRLQSAAGATAGVALFLGFLASIGLRFFPMLSPAGLWVVALFLLAAGAVGGAATVGRGEEIDRRRWELVEDPLITSGEREYAHKEAERERRWAGIVFFTAPVALAYCAAGHLPADAGAGASPLLALVPIAGYLGGLIGIHVRRDRPER